MPKRSSVVADPTTHISDIRGPGPVQRVPWWVTALDVLCLILLALLVRSLLGVRYRISLTPEIRISLGSWWRIALWLGASLVVRHLAWRVVPWHSRVVGWVRAMWRWEPLRAAWPVFIVSRITVLLIGYVSVFTVGIKPPRPWRALSNDFLDLYARWDSGWYYQIAGLGYSSRFNPERTSEFAFFPGLPLLMRGVRTVLDVNLWVAGIILVVCAFLWALTYVYRLARQDLPPDQARASLMFLAFYPFAVCYNAVLSESLFLLAAAAAFYHFRRAELWKAAVFGLLAGTLRPNGFLLCVPLGLLALIPFARSRRWLPGPPASAETRWTTLSGQLLAASVPLIGVLAISIYLDTKTGDPLAWMKAQQAWGRTTSEGFNVIELRRELIDAQGLASYLRSYPIEIIEAAAAFFALSLVWPIVRRFGLAYGVFVAMSVLPPLITMGSISLGRYTAPLFPMFLLLGATVSPDRRPYWVGAFAAGQALIAVLFFTWRPPT